MSASPGSWFGIAASRGRATQNADSRRHVSVAGACLTAGAAAAAAAAVVVAAVPGNDSLPIYLPVARLLAQGVAPSPFVPAGYPMFLSAVHAVIAGSLGAAGWDATIAIGHGVLLVATACLAAAAVYRLGGRLSRVESAVVGLLVSVMLLRTLTRADDNALAVPLTLACFVWLLSPGARAVTDVLIGGCLGGLVLVRPNLAVLVLPLAWVALRQRRPIGLAAIAGTAGLLSLFLPGLYGYAVPHLPQNGAYNLFVGNNPFVKDAVVVDRNPESSLGPALAYFRLPPAAPQAFWWEPRRPVADAVLRGAAIRWAVSHPAAWAQALLYKAYCLVAPPPARRAPARVLNVVLLLVPAAGVCAILYGQRRGRVTRSEAATLCTFGLLFCGPLVLFVSPARLRLPLDVCVVVMAWAAMTRRPRSDPAGT